MYKEAFSLHNVPRLFLQLGRSYAIIVTSKQSLVGNGYVLCILIFGYPCQISSQQFQDFSPCHRSLTVRLLRDMSISAFEKLTWHDEKKVPLLYFVVILYSSQNSIAHRYLYDSYRESYMIPQIYAQDARTEAQPTPVFRNTLVLSRWIGGYKGNAWAFLGIHPFHDKLEHWLEIFLANSTQQLGPCGPEIWTNAVRNKAPSVEVGHFTHDFTLGQSLRHSLEVEDQEGLM
ncbi:hypothetical protein JHW43_008243 [Diplocarpon mali]|nr:hypothetical protein JHW43_008243 [Diplocarpon mali]